MAYINMQQRGFSLFELLSVLLILGLLAAFTLPSYQNHLYKIRRADGQAALLDLATKIEHYYSLNHSYAGITLEKLGMPDKSSEEFYKLEIVANSPTAYTIQATPLGSQKNDKQCQTLTYDQLGQKDATGSGTIAECW